MAVCSHQTAIRHVVTRLEQELVATRQLCPGGLWVLGLRLRFGGLWFFGLWFGGLWFFGLWLFGRWCFGRFGGLWFRFFGLWFFGLGFFGLW